MFATEDIKDYRLRRAAIIFVIVFLTIPTILFYTLRGALDMLEQVVRELVCYAPAEIHKQWRRDFDGR